MHRARCADSTRRALAFADATRDALRCASDRGGLARFDPETLRELPAPARRLLISAVPAGSPLSGLVELDMLGQIKLGGRWLPFTAHQTLRAGVGLVWAAVVGGRVFRFVGADVLGSDDARLEFRLHGRVPVVRRSGESVRRSAQGRLAAETVAWLPQALTPQAGAHWTGIDDDRAIVTVDAAGADIEVEVEVDEGGALRWLALQRWNDSAKPPAEASFGGTVDATLVSPSGIGIAGRGTVGWEWRTHSQADGVFFRYEVTKARFDDPGMPETEAT